MTLKPGLRKLALIAHITSSVGWLGAIVAFLPLSLAALTSHDDQTVRAAYLAMSSIGWFALVPLASGSLLTGLVMSLGTRWGLFRYYWVLVKFLITVLASIILLKYLQTLGDLAGLAAQTASSAADLGGLRSPTHLAHAAAALLALLMNATLSVYKPRGMTRYGRRKQEGQPAPADTGDAGGGPGREPAAGAPRWVRVLGVIAIVVVLMLIVLQLAGVVGSHGPGRHMR